MIFPSPPKDLMSVANSEERETRAPVWSAPQALAELNAIADLFEIATADTTISRRTGLGLARDVRSAMATLARVSREIKLDNLRALGAIASSPPVRETLPEWRCNGCDRSVSQSEIDAGREVCECRGDFFEVAHVYGEIRAERARQDAQWGGPTHDDQHQDDDWRRFREGFEEKVLFSGTGYTRKGLIAIAALAIAQLESFDRLRALPPETGS